MAAWSDNEVSTPNERRSFFRENDAKSSSRSPSIGSFEIWPSFLVSKTLPQKVSDKGIFISL